MKLRILLFSSLLLLSAGTAWADVTINETNFPDANFRSWLLSQDYGSDRKLTEAEIAGVTSISVSSKSIQSLKGIEYFTALTDLWCNTNQLTTLDVSKNTALKYLYCRDNNLTSLNVSGCTALEWLDCHNNQLTSLDVSKNTRLSLLQCYSNQLTSLDVSGCTMLDYLSCHGNQLSSLDVSKNTALGTLYCGGNQLTSLDVSKNTKLGNLSCSINQLTSLNVSGCTSLTKLDCYKNQINGAAMDVLVSSLPNVGNGTMRVVYNENEQNVITTTQIAVAKGKGWVPHYYDGSSWKEYVGIDPIVEEGITINEENFPDANFRNYLLEQDYGSDGKLTIAEIAGVTSIDVHSKSIQSLQGIEYFTALKRLDCYSNQLTSLDVSKNNALTELRCYNNTYTLSSLNVSGCTALKTLMCNNNYLTSLDLSKNTALTELNCSRNPLTSLDVSKNTALTRLVCYTNYLTSLDVSKNIELTRLECYDNQLTSLDLSKNTALTSLSCYNNQLTSLDLSKNTALTMLYCNDNKLTSLDVSKNTALTELRCNYNQLTSLDVSKNTALTTLYCDNNQLTSLDVSNNTALTYLDCSNNQLTSLDVSKNTALIKLWCYGNKINGDAMDALVASLPTGNFCSMYVIYNANEQNVMTFIQVAAAKAKGWSVDYYNGSWSSYPGSGIVINEDYFPDAIFRNYLLSQSFGSDGILTYNEMTKVTSINVSDKSIRSLKGIEYFTALTELRCGGNKLTSLDLSKNTALTELYCSYTQLTSLDVSKNTALTRLSCSDNKITSLDLSKNTALTRLSCYNNQLASLDVSKNTALTELDCSDNQLTSLDVSKNTALTYLVCQINQLTSLDVSGCTALAWLDCHNNQLTSLDVSKNTKLNTLYCYQNKIKGDGMDALVESLPVKNYRTMRVIYYKNEQNVMTTTQVAVAKFRGWTPYYTEDGTNWKEYSGGEPIVEGIAINEKNFPDANFRSWLKSQSYGSDGVLTTEEIAGVTSIDVSSKSIQSLKGIEFFTALTELYCYQNKINGNNMYALIEMLPTVTAGTLDVIFNEDEQNEMNTAQVAVVKAKGWTPRCYDGVKWEEYAGSVSDIAISTTIFPDYTFRSWLRSQSYGSDGVLTPAEIAEVTSISVPWVWPRIQSLQGIEFFTALTELDCSGNELTSLDVSKNTKLTRLHCYSNQLTTLDVSKNTELTWLWCSNNQLTSLDVSGCTALAWLDCSSNQIKGAAMDVLVSSLPNVSSGEMYVMCNENEQNVMTTTQVTAAKAKGWIPYYTNGNIYAGVDPSTAVNNVEAADAEDSAPWYTINGVKLTEKPTAPGIYIHNGKKVIVK